MTVCTGYLDQAAKKNGYTANHWYMSRLRRVSNIRKVWRVGTDSLLKHWRLYPLGISSQLERLSPPSHVGCRAHNLGGMEPLVGRGVGLPMYVGSIQNMKELTDLEAVPHTSMCMGVDSFTERRGGPAQEVLISPCGGT